MAVCRGALVVSLLLLAVTSRCYAQDPPAACPQKMAMKDFNATAYMGKWYEYAKFGWTPYEEGGVCVTAQYSLDGDNNVTVVNSMVDNKSREAVNKTAWAGFQDDSGDAKLTVHFPGRPVGGMYWVLNTDYSSFSIVWACGEVPQSSNVTETSWILLRDRSITNATKEKLDEALQQADLQLQRYTMTEQSADVCGGAGQLLATCLTLALSLLVALLH